MSNIDISKIKPGDFVQVSEKWYEVEKVYSNGVAVHVPAADADHYINRSIITAHRTAQPAADAPQEWLTANEWVECGYEAVNRGSDSQDYADTINALLTRKFGKPSDMVSKRDVAMAINRATADAVLRQKIKQSLGISV